MSVADAPPIPGISSSTDKPDPGDEALSEVDEALSEADSVARTISVVVGPNELRFLHEMFSAAEVHGNEVRNVAQLLDTISAVDPESGKLAVGLAGRTLIRQVLAGIFDGDVRISGSRAQAAVSLDQKFRGEPAAD